MRATSKRSRYQARVPSRPSPLRLTLSLLPHLRPSGRRRGRQRSPQSLPIPTPPASRVHGFLPPASPERGRSRPVPDPPFPVPRLVSCSGCVVPGCRVPALGPGSPGLPFAGSRARSCPAWGVVGSQPSGAAPLPPPSRSNRLRGSFGYLSCGKSPDCFFRRAPIALAAPRISRSSPPGLLLVPNLRQTGPHQSIALNPPCVSPDPCPLPPSPPTNHAPKIRRCIGRGRRAFCESG
jgi:hypothetical protein|uniref:Uncharacterized protein n=1 Tax=Zea mays TaxID=4577 RepID=C4J281_MAIZE|nr:unknown [Zea mays]